ncbi:hypothetical protein JTE90_008484 [Oedothorax gibbosus]|uniref:Uncharacterized protein n=1 Tax=Oedothorax gibbosus TaxID=931172 RepID=A0AAV6V0L0_9ARAC|nr:hypothetical protein JTE90_008484 [Oedothorax gibbosus]
MAIDVYNDSRLMTLSANSWPLRSLAKIHSDSQIATYREHGLDASFTPCASVFHYRNPNTYREMLDVVADTVMTPVLEELKAADCFSLQVDGSVDKYCIENIFITARYVTKSSGIKNVFLGESFSDKHGAEAHRSDLVYTDLEAMVSEVKHWRLCLKSVTTYYRTSAVRTGELKAISLETENKFLRFPTYFEVRFVEHLVHLASCCILGNLLAMQKHWNAVIESKHSNRIERATARGLAKVWISGGDKELLTALMIDVMRVIRNLQKDFQ